MRRWILVVVLLLALSGVHAFGNHRLSRFLSSFSFKSPFFPESGLAAVPGWEIQGSTSVMPDLIRLTPNEKDRAGSLLNRRPFFLRSIELTLEFRIHSTGRQGADGLAFWLADAPARLGPVFGGPETWNGLAVIMDTYDNDGSGQHPMIALHFNDGSKSFEFGTDGSTTLLSSCPVAYRNVASSSLLHLFIEDDTVHMFVDVENTGDYVRCGEPTQVKMPNRYFFSFTALTGGYSDNHDLISFKVNTMDAKLTMPEDGEHPEVKKRAEEKKKREQEEQEQAEEQVASQEEKEEEKEANTEEAKADDQATEPAQDANEDVPSPMKSPGSKSVDQIIQDLEEKLKQAQEDADTQKQAAEEARRLLEKQATDDERKAHDWAQKEKELNNAQKMAQESLEQQNQRRAHKLAKAIDCEEIRADCTNVHPIYSDLTSSVKQTEETFGHELVELQYLLNDRLHRLSDHTNPIKDSSLRLRTEIDTTSVAVKQIEQTITTLFTLTADQSQAGKGGSAAYSDMLNSLTVTVKTLSQIQVEQRKLQDRLESLQDKVKQLDRGNHVEMLVVVILFLVVVLNVYQFYVKQRSRRGRGALY